MVHVGTNQSKCLSLYIVAMVKREGHKVKRILLLAVIFVAIAAGVVTSCLPAGDEPELEIRPAPIHEVRVNIAESDPPQVFIYIKGGLTDGATTFHEAKVERSGNTINLTLTTQRPKDTVATQVYGYFEENVALGIDFTYGEIYTVIVNDQTTSFVMLS